MSWLCLLILCVSAVSSAEEKALAADTAEESAPGADETRAAATQRQALLDRIAKLESAATQNTVSVSAAPGKGFVIKSLDEKYSIGARARIQLRDTFTHAHAPLSDLNEVQLRTLRLTIAGNALSPHFKYTVQLAFGGGDFDRENASPVFDAFVDYTAVRDANVRIGQFFVPFDRARTIREFALQFVDRQQVVRELTLDRDVGVMLSSTNLFGLSEKLGYHVFLGGGDGRNRFTTTKTGPLATARVVVRPFGLFDDDQEGDLTRERRVRMALGVAGAYNAETSKVGSTTGNNFAFGQTDYRNAVVDLHLKYAGFSLLTEALWRRARHDALEGTANGAPATEWSRSGYGYVVQAGMMLNASLEVVGRWEKLFALKRTDPRLIELANLQGKQVGGGVNYYLNGHALKIQADAFRVFGLAGAQRSLVRLQLDASF